MMSNPTLTIRTIGDKQEVFDVTRKRFVALTPEEWVRQNLLHLLHNQYAYPFELMMVEGSINVNGLTKRCDIVVYLPSGKPCLIVECKRANVPINQKVVDQACRYNTVLNVPLLLLSNGNQTLVLKVQATPPHLQQINHIPHWNQLPSYM